MWLNFWKNLLQMAVLLFPGMWKSISISTKILFTMLSFMAVIGYLLFSFWGAIRTSGISAANEWWDDKYHVAHKDNDKLRDDILGSLKRIEDGMNKQGDDIKFLNRTLIKRNNP